MIVHGLSMQFMSLKSVCHVKTGSFTSCMFLCELMLLETHNDMRLQKLQFVRCSNCALKFAVVAYFVLMMI